MAKMAYLDEALEQEGRWATWLNGIRLRLRRWRNPDHVARFEAISEERRKELEPLSESQRIEKLEDWLDEAAAGTVLVGWGNIDEAPEFSTEKAVEFLTDSRLSHLCEFIRRASGNLLQYIEDAAGN